MTVLEGIAEERGEFTSLREKISRQGLGGIFAFILLLKEGKELFSLHPPRKATELFLEKIQYKKALFNEVKSEQAQENKWANIQEAISSLAEMDATFSLQEFLSETMLGTSSLKKKKSEGDFLNLVTFHSAKGLEFPACFIIGLEDHIIPHERSQTKEGIEEERRLLYVAITRAMRFLTLSMVRKREFRGKKIDTNPSRFLFELPKEFLKMTSWRSNNENNHH